MSKPENGDKSRDLFNGHTFVAVSYFILAISWLGVILKRSCNLPAGVSYNDMHVPEMNRGLLSRLGKIVMVITSVGVMIEGIGGVLFKHTLIGFLFQRMHLVVYSAGTFLGLCFYLESQRKLPVEAGRSAAVFFFLVQYVMFGAHAKMKPTIVNGMLHELLNLCHLVFAALTAYSIKYPQSGIAYVASAGTLLFFAIWYETIAIYLLTGWDLKMHDVHILFAAEALFLVFVMTAVSSYVLPPWEDQTQSLSTNNNNNRNRNQSYKLVDGKGEDAERVSFL